MSIPPKTLSELAPLVDRVRASYADYVRAEDRLNAAREELRSAEQAFKSAGESFSAVNAELNTGVLGSEPWDRFCFGRSSLWPNMQGFVPEPANPTIPGELPSRRPDYSGPRSGQPKC